MIINVNNKLQITNNQPPLIIAEISGNHCGSKKKFLEHIKSAAKNGADLIKIQTYEPSDITLNNKDYLIDSGIWKSKSLWSIYQDAHTPYDWHESAFRLAKKLGIILFSTPFSTRAVDFLEKFNVLIYKISSFEITDFNLINYIASKNKLIILSTGTATNKEIRAAIKIINKYHNKVIVLHCVSNYPTLENEAQIRKIINLRKQFKKNLIGLSDHTNDINSCLASIPLGSVIIEKHYKINDKIQSPDSKFSITPSQLRRLKELTSKIYNTLGNQDKTEKKINKKVLFFRRSIYALEDIFKGSVITKKNIIALRPKIGIEANKYFDILGKKIKRNIKKNSPIFKRDLL